MSTVWKKKEVASSKFDLTKVDELRLKKEDVVTQEQFNQVYGEDVFIQSMKQQSEELDAGHILKNRFGEEVIPEKEVELSGMVQDTYHAFRGKNVGSMELGKRSKEAKNKISLQNHLRNEKKAFIKKHEAERAEALRYTSKNMKQDAVSKHFTTDYEREAVREWLVFDDVTKENARHYAGSNMVASSDNFRRMEYMKILFQVEHISIDEFDDADEGEFASKYAEKYDKLCKMACADVFMGKFMEITKGVTFGLNVTELNAKITFAKQMKEQYENRMELISSPYFALLRKADMEPYMGEGKEAKIDAIKDEKLRDYIKLYRKTMGSSLAFGKSKQMHKAYKDMLDTEQRQAKERDVQRIKVLLDEIKDMKNEEQELTKTDQTVRDEIKKDEERDYDDENAENLHQYYRLKRRRLEKTFPKDEMQFMKETVAYVGPDKIFSSEDGELQEIERVLTEDIMEKQSIDGVPISAEVFEKVKNAFSEFIGARRKFLSYIHASNFASELCFGLQCDLKNPMFAKTKEAKALKKFKREDGMPDTITNDEKMYAARNIYIQTLSEIYRILNANGYKISKKYDERLEKGGRGDQELEESRVKKEKWLQKKNPDAVYHYPTFTLNGVPYTFYDEEQEDDVIFFGKNANIEGEDKAEAEKLMADFAENRRKIAAVNILFSDASGIRGVMCVAYKKNLSTDAMQMRARLAEIFNKNGVQL